MAPRVMLIGLDCVPPSLAFDAFAGDMPVLSSLRARGTSGPLRSCVPPITVPAWACMTSGRLPGELGMYGFRDRVAGSYALRTNDARAMCEPRIWDVACDAGLRAAALFVPPSWPPPEEREGLSVVSCLLTPDDGAGWASPRALEDELRAHVGAYVPDVDTSDIGAVADMTAQHFSIARQVLDTRAPDLFAMVEIGTDRLHHAAWSRPDRMRSFYAQVDRELATLLERAGDGTTVIVASDHGARTMLGAVRINEWLAREGWLVLRSRAERPVAIADCDVDWSKTRAWGEGGYHGRVFLNVRGREAEGCIDPDDAVRVRAELAAAVREMKDDAGAPLGNVVHDRDALYPGARGTPPDLTVLFGDLAYRANGTIGGAVPASIVATDTDAGRGGCNHDHDGIVVLAGAGIDARGELRDAELVDVFATCCARLGIAAPPGTHGRDLSRGLA
jgi:predicted AlkP superfamily phosphohydrolase/phosphomutase